MADQNAYAVGETRPAAVPVAPQTQAEPTLAELFGTLIADAQTLLRREVDLAKAEVGAEIDKVRQVAMMLGVGAGIAAVGALFLLAALAEGLVAADIADRWLAYFLVGATLAIAGAIALVVGRQRLQTVDPMPRETIDSLRKDASAISEQLPTDRG